MWKNLVNSSKKFGNKSLIAYMYMSLIIFSTSYFRNAFEVLNSASCRILVPFNTVIDTVVYTVLKVYVRYP